MAPVTLRVISNPPGQKNTHTRLIESAVRLQRNGSQFDHPVRDEMRRPRQQLVLFGRATIPRIWVCGKWTQPVAKISTSGAAGFEATIGPTVTPSSRSWCT